MTLATVARQVGMHPTTTLRMLESLRVRGMVRVERGGPLRGRSGHPRAGQELPRAGSRSRALPMRPSRRWPRKVDETASVGVLDEGQVLVHRDRAWSAGVRHPVAALRAPSPPLHGARQGAAGGSAAAAGRGAAGAIAARGPDTEHHHRPRALAGRAQERGGARLRGRRRGAHAGGAVHRRAGARPQRQGGRLPSRSRVRRFACAERASTGSPRR